MRVLNMEDMFEKLRPNVLHPVIHHCNNFPVTYAVVILDATYFTCDLLHEIQFVAYDDVFKVQRFPFSESFSNVYTIHRI